MKVFITGVHGQLGHDVEIEAAKRGHKCIGSDILTSSPFLDSSNNGSEFDFCQLDTISGDNKSDNGSDTATAIRINCRSLSLEITNLASRSVIHETIASLLSLC